MKVFEILSLNREFLDRLNSFGINPDDYKWTELYLDYIKMREKGEKSTYIVAVLSEKYNICERKVYKIIHKMEIDCQIGALV